MFFFSLIPYCLNYISHILFNFSNLTLNFIQFLSFIMMAIQNHVLEAKRFMDRKP